MKVFLLFMLTLLSGIAAQPHLPNTKYGEWQYVDYDTTWSAEYDSGSAGSASSITFKNEAPAELFTSFLWRDIMTPETDYPTTVDLIYPITDLKGAPDLKLSLYPEGTINSACGTPSYGCLDSETPLWESKVKSMGLDTQVKYDLTPVLRLALTDEIVLADAVLSLDKLGTGHEITLDLENTFQQISVEERPAYHWPPGAPCEEKTVKVLAQNDTLGEGFDVYYIDCPNQSESNLVYFFESMVPGNAEVFGNILDALYAEHSLMENGRVIVRDRLGHGRSAIPPSDDFWKIWSQEAEVADFLSQVLEPGEKILALSTDRNGPGLYSHVSRNTSWEHVAGILGYESWLSTACAPENDGIFCSRRYYFGGFPLNYDHTPDPISSWLYTSDTSCDADKLAFDFLDCTYDDNCGDCIHKDYLYFHNDTFYLDTSPDGPTRCFQKYVNPITGQPEPFDWVASLFGVFTGQHPYDLNTCTKLPYISFTPQNLNPNVILDQEEIDNLKKFYDPDLYPDALDRRHVYTLEPREIPFATAWADNKCGYGVPGQTCADLIYEYMTVLETMDPEEGAPYLFIYDFPANSAAVIPILDKEYIQTWPSVEYKLWNGDYPHWAFMSHPGALQFELYRRGQWLIDNGRV